MNDETLYNVGGGRSRSSCRCCKFLERNKRRLQCARAPLHSEKARQSVLYERLGSYFILLTELKHGS